MTRHQSKPPYAYLDDDDGDDDRASHLVEGLIEMGTSVMLIAPPFTGKSLWAGHLALCVAGKRLFFGRPVAHGLVVYVAGERYRSTRRRLKAAARELGIKNAPLITYRRSPNLADEKRVKAFLREVTDAASRRGLPIALIIFDTLAKAMVGRDENTAKDAGMVMKGVDDIVDATGATVLLNHHPAKDGRGSRGSGAFLGAADAWFSLSNRNGVRVVKLEEANDLKSDQVLNFTLQSVDFNGMIVPLLVEGSEAPVDIEVGGRVKRATRILELIFSIGEDRTIDRHDLFAKACAKGIISGTTNDSRREQFRQALKNLEGNKQIRFDGTAVTPINAASQGAANPTAPPKEGGGIGVERWAPGKPNTEAQRADVGRVGPLGVSALLDKESTASDTAPRAATFIEK